MSISAIITFFAILGRISVPDGGTGEGTDLMQMHDKVWGDREHKGS